MHPLLNSSSVLFQQNSGDELRRASQRRLLKARGRRAAEPRKVSVARLQRAPAAR